MSDAVLRTVSVRLGEGQYRELRVLAAKCGCSMGALVAGLVDDALVADREKWKAMGRERSEAPAMVGQNPPSRPGPAGREPGGEVLEVEPGPKFQDQVARDVVKPDQGLSTVARAKRPHRHVSEPPVSCEGGRWVDNPALGKVCGVCHVPKAKHP